MWSDKDMPAFQKNLLPPSSVMAVGSSKTLVNLYQITQHHWHYNLESHNCYYVLCNNCSCFGRSCFRWDLMTFFIAQLDWGIYVVQCFTTEGHM